MLLRNSIADYKHIDLGNVKVAFTQVCKDELFKDVYFSANTLYYVESGHAVLHTRNGSVTVKENEVVLLRQHSKLDIQKFKSKEGKDFRSIIFYLFPDFVIEFLGKTKKSSIRSDISTIDAIALGKHKYLQSFCESLLPLFNKAHLASSEIKKKTFDALLYLSKYNKNLNGFLLANSQPIKIDLYEFMIHNVFSTYSVNELARLTGRSLSGFKRDFYQVFETTPHQWLLGQRIDVAEKLLKAKKMKASKIYFMMGFNELSHFSAAYKKRKGISPAHV